MVEEFFTQEQKDFIDAKPVGNQPQSFPQMFLNRNEKVIYEGRPSISAYILRPIVVGLIYTIFFGVSIFALLSAVGQGIIGLFWLIFIVVITLVLPLLFSILRWSRTYYAMTDRRVTHTYGLFSRQSSDIPVDKIMNVLLIQPFFERIFGYGSIVFTTAGAGGSMRLKGFYRSGAVVWRASKQPIQVKNYVQEVLDILQKAQKAKDYREMSKAMKD
jgi:uncharacterized membrane protein YdbT with pleckstrin-like domain